ncbi:hypothetical protein [Tropicibacter alexandrii]|jgi:hypothetical protein|uniref:hypothetical protein n=1 Tax=Tropicibacter alexandrii TaxID=2267683 RepID=UPI000EF4B64F|nr:hypothetical protein [Tropicibacter alexandrii]
MIYVAGLLIAFILIAVFSNPATRACRWREYRQGDSVRWHCIQCGAEVYKPLGQKPKSCFRNDRA